jgi:UDP-glucose 4-epimerase
VARWLITGGCGFIGRNLIRRLVTLPNTLIRVIDDLSVGTREDLAAICPLIDADPGSREWQSACALVVGNIRDAALASSVVAGADIVVHLAANTGVGPSVADPRADCITNVVGTLNYLEACRENGVSRFVFASSGAPVGDCEPPIHENLPARPVSPYGASKLAGEAYCSAYKRCFGIDAVALRFGNCYGPNSKHKSSIVAKFIRAAIERKTWYIHGDGGQTRDFIYVDDVTDAICRAATTAEVGGEVFQIATNRETTVTELAVLLSKILKENHVEPVRIRHDDPQIGDVKRNYSDTSKAFARLGWRSQVPLDDGLARTVHWFLDQR